MADDITALLVRMGEGDADATERVVGALYQELRARAAAYMRKQRPGHTLQPTALVHEVFYKLAGAAGSWRDRRHFIAVAARAMRQVLTDYARGKRARKRLAERDASVPLEQIVVEFEDRAMDLIALDEALVQMQAFDAPMARVVELRFYAGLSAQEAADEVGISRRTVDRKWATTLAWLRTRMS